LAGCTSVIYRGLFDRVTIDENGYLWLNDYKNVASRTKLINLELDPQIGAYMWAASYMYDIPVLGFIYTQLKKTAVLPPKILKKGNISADVNQNTTHRLYRQALVDLYGIETANWPSDNMECLNTLAAHEEEDRDKFVSRDYISRTKNSMQKEVERLLMEVEEMLNPKLPIYPNPSYRCAETCSFQTPCIEKYKMENFGATLASEYVSDDYKNRNSWRDNLKIGLIETPTFVIKP
jgi:PD-(D/E)XK nuclease superfamily